ncbi:hypothetical protein MMC17_006159 [Xylographa soralifera]|nr:hypothetical protein [Xylographa soralifera]
MLMLTYVSIKDVKVVHLHHKQIVAAVPGKASVRPLHRNGSFLNWIGHDHVASLIETHVQTLWLGVDQIHIDTADVVSSPKVLLGLLSRHRVCRTSAPNFFPLHLVSTAQIKGDDESWDLSNLQIVVSRGEANDVKAYVAVSSLFRKYVAYCNVITPGFGMTETCTGAIFNLGCPDYGVERNYAVASLGKCMKGIEIRLITDSRLTATDEPGDLEVRGDMIFDGYYRNPEATADAFPSQDGSFYTRNQACIDSSGYLCLICRNKEVININDVRSYSRHCSAARAGNRL